MDETYDFGTEWLTTEQARDKLMGLFGIEEIRRIAREQGWETKKERRRWLIKASDVEFPDWPLSYAQKVLVDIARPDMNIPTNWCEAKLFAKAIGWTAKTISASGLRIVLIETAVFPEIILVAENDKGGFEILFSRYQIEETSKGNLLSLCMTEVDTLVSKARGVSGGTLELEEERP